MSSRKSLSIAFHVQVPCTVLGQDPGGTIGPECLLSELSVLPHHASFLGELTVIHPGPCPLDTPASPHRLPGPAKAVTLLWPHPDWSIGRSVDVSSGGDKPMGYWAPP